MNLKKAMERMNRRRDAHKAELEAEMDRTLTALMDHRGLQGKEREAFRANWLDLRRRFEAGQLHIRVLH